ncbi:MAG: Spo0B domain-containing protein [Sporolactobacillus sp.]
MIREEEGLQIISSARHVLLNQLQLIKGYMYMQNPQKANAVIDQLTARLRVQSQLSRLGLPQTTFYLLTKSWSALPYKLLIRVADGVQRSIEPARLALLDQRLKILLEDIALYLQKSVCDSVENTVDLLFLDDQNGLQIKLFFSGLLQSGKTLPGELRERLMNGSFAWKDNYIEATEQQKMRWDLCLLIK